jgi:hypothetical protein
MWCCNVSLSVQRPSKASSTNRELDNCCCVAYSLTRRSDCAENVHRFRKHSHFLFQTLHNVNVLSYAGSIQPKYKQQICRNTNFTTWPFVRVVFQSTSVKGPYTLSVKLSDFNCDVIPDGKTEQTAQFWQEITQASELSFPDVFYMEKLSKLRSFDRK